MEVFIVLAVSICIVCAIGALCTALIVFGKRLRWRYRIFIGVVLTLALLAAVLITITFYVYVYNGNWF